MRPIVPFHDVHTHLCGYGVSLNRPDIGAARSYGEAVAITRRWMEGGRASVVVATGFDETTWPERRVPTRRELDADFPDAPVVFRRVCGHIATANSAALGRIGEGWGIVHRDSGLLEEDVVLRINEAVGVSEGETLAGAERGVHEAYRRGIAGVGEVCSLPQFRALRSLASGGMALRVAAFLPFDDAMRLRDSGVRPGRVAGGLEFRGVKLFLDGSLGGRTAALSSDYADAPGNRGMLLVEDARLCEIVRACEDLGMQLMMHAIGDRAIAQALDALERCAAKGNPLGHRIEHAEVLDPGTMSRVKGLGARLSLQPNFAGRWSGVGGMNWTRLGAERHRWCNPYGSIVEAKIPCAFGSDCMPLDPFFGLRSAVGHPVAAERLSEEVALRLYTRDAAAFLGFELDGRDRLELSSDPFDERCEATELEIAGRRLLG